MEANLMLTSLTPSHSPCPFQHHTQRSHSYAQAAAKTSGAHAIDTEPEPPVTAPNDGMLSKCDRLRECELQHYDGRIERAVAFL